MTKYTSPTKKARICRDKAAGLSDSDIAKKFRIHRTTVKRIFESCAQSEDYYTVKPKSGRPRLFTSNDTRRAVRLLAKGEAHSDASDLQRKFFPEINAETIRTRLRASGLKGYVRRPKPFLTEAHRKRRLEWVKAHAHWTRDNWRTVVFSDESKYNRFGSDGREWCWRRPGEGFDTRYTKKVVKHGGGSVMEWGGVSQPPGRAGFAASKATWTQSYSTVGSRLSEIQPTFHPNSGIMSPMGWVKYARTR